MKEKLAQAFSDQINKEYYSAFLYLDMANWLNSIGLPGAANWTYVQYQEELAHAQNLFLYLLRREVCADLKPIAEPEGNWDSALDVFKHVLAHEKTVTASIDNLVSLAMEEKDHAAYIFLQWYVTEQVEEESTASDLVQKLEMAGNHANALLMLDGQMAGRTFTPPVVPGLV